jgi:hypothetical protein
MVEPLESGLPGLALLPGDHICALYYGQPDRDEVLLPYLRTGLRAGDKCLAMMDGDLVQLVADIGNGNGLAASDQLDVRAAPDAYLDAGRFSAHRMITFIDASVSAALSGGYHFVRTVGEVPWLLERPPGAEEFFDYESELNRFSPSYPQVVLCMYDMQRFGGSVLVDMLKTHPKLLLGGMVLDNPHFLSPDEYRAARQ